MDEKLILVTDDESDIRLLITYNLKKNGFNTIESSCGADAIKMARENHPALIILDLMMSDISGLDVLRILKTSDDTKDIAIIIASAKGQDYDITRGLDLGADDYITKPFSPNVLVSRVKSVLRRYQSDSKSAIKNGDNLLTLTKDNKTITLDSARHTLTYSTNKTSDKTSGALDLSSKEFAIFEYLLKNIGFVFSRQKIIDAVAGGDYTITERTIDVEIFSIRKKFDEVGIKSIIETVRGVGYKINE